MRTPPGCTVWVKHATLCYSVPDKLCEWRQRRKHGLFGMECALGVSGSIIALLYGSSLWPAARLIWSQCTEWCSIISTHDASASLSEKMQLREKTAGKNNNIKIQTWSNILRSYHYHIIKSPQHLIVRILFCTLLSFTSEQKKRLPVFLFQKTYFSNKCSLKYLRLWVNKLHKPYVI